MRLASKTFYPFLHYRRVRTFTLPYSTFIVKTWLDMRKKPALRLFYSYETFEFHPAIFNNYAGCLVHVTPTFTAQQGEDP